MRVVLVTRAAPEAEATAARVRALGHAAIVSPVLEIEPVPFVIDAESVAALLFTSAAAIRAAQGQAALKAKPALVVGEATAAAARAAGFADVRTAAGAGADLIALACASAPPGALCHLRGADVAVDIADALRRAGRTVHEAIVYRAAPAAALTPAAARALREGPALDSVLLHSARGGESLCRLLRAAGLAEAAAALDALCLSERVAQAARALTWREIRVAPAPREPALLSMLDSSAGVRT